MHYKGHIQNGVVVLDDAVDLAEGARVRIEVLQESLSEPLHREIIRFTGVLPPDVDVRAEYTAAVAKKHA